MLSSLSCRIVKLESSSSVVKLSSRQGKNNIFQSKIVGSVSGKNRESSNNNGSATGLCLKRLLSGSPAIIHILIVTLLLAIFLIQGLLSKLADISTL